MLEKEILFPDPMSPDELVSHCGSYSRAVDTVMSFERALWELAFIDYTEDPADPAEEFPDQAEEPKAVGEKVERGFYQIINAQRLTFPAYLHKHFQDKLPTPIESLMPKLLSHLRAREMCWPHERERLGVANEVFHPVSLARSFLGKIKPEHELRYFLRHNVRRHYRQTLSSQTAHFFHLLAKAMNSWEWFNDPTEKETRGRKHKSYLIYRTECLDRMTEVVRNDRICFGMLRSLSEDPHWRRDPLDILELFVECCRATGSIGVDSHHRGCIRPRAKFIDAEFLISRLFGMPTDIPGFDDLFGGGGLLLAEDLEGVRPKVAKLRGRTILIMGRFGTGKSLLSMQLAVEVARKGGLALIMPLEQSAEDCLYTLESMAALPSDGSVIVPNNYSEAILISRQRKKERGALIILKGITNSIDNFLKAFIDNAKDIQEYPLRLISVDPINSIPVRESGADLRSLMGEKLDVIKDLGTNVMLVAEEGSTQSEQLGFEQNIADTVIHLSINKDRNGNYAQRYFEITKSRFQREQRGEHAFSIVPGKGFRIFPSTAAVHARINPRALVSGSEAIKVGPPSLDDEILREGAVMKGDVIVFQGPIGTFKTQLSMYFALGSDSFSRSSGEQEPPRSVPKEGIKRPAKTLFLATRNNEQTIRRLINQQFVVQYEATLASKFRTSLTAPKKRSDIKVCPLRYGYVQPGYILQAVKDEFLNADVGGYRIDRVLIDNIAHWEMSSPFIRDDEAFGNILLEFLRRQPVTTLVICGKTSPGERSVLQRSIVDNADCVIRFERSGLGIVGRVIKARGMGRRQRREFLVQYAPQGIELVVPDEASSRDDALSLEARDVGESPPRSDED